MSLCRVPALVFLLLAAGCASRPAVIQHPVFSFPKESAFTDDVTRPYEVLGQVRARVDFPSLDSNREIEDLCKNYFHKGVRQLVKFAREKGGDAVIGVRSIVFLEDGRREEYPRAECSDDGAEGQLLAQGIAVRWKPEPGASPAPRVVKEEDGRARIQPIRRRVKQGEFLPSGDPTRPTPPRDPRAFPSRVGRE